MSNHPLLADFETLRVPTRAFINDVVIPAEPWPPERPEEATQDQLPNAAKTCWVLAPHVQDELGRQGVPVNYWWADVYAQRAGVQ